MKKTIVILGLAIFAIACKGKTEKASEKLSMNEVAVSNKIETTQNEWEVLFDGTSFDEWKGYLKDEIGDAWKIEDNAMVFYPPKDREKGENYNLVTKTEYTDFLLSLEWRISEGGNSGIFWGVNEIPTLNEAYQTGPEVQILDNLRHPDAKAGTTHQAGALYDMVSPIKDVTRPVGEWNTIEIMVNHKTNTGKVAMNGENLVEFPVNDPEWGAMVAKSKFSDWEHFGKYTTGKIGLQDHGDGVSFRNIKIKKL